MMVPTLRFGLVLLIALGGIAQRARSSDNFDAAWVTCPTLVREDDGRYRMWYSSFFDSREGPGGIGHATSTNGRDWIRDNAPVLRVGAEGALDEGQVMGPEVLRRDDGYYMWYTGMSRQRHASGLGYYRIFLATSDDGLQWQRANHGKPVIDIGRPDAPDNVQAATPSVVYERDHFRMWYAAWSPHNGHTICVATSNDGSAWQRENDGKPVRGLDPSEAFGPAVAKLQDGYLLLYMALKAPKGLFAAHSRDGIIWQMLNAGKPVLSPGEPGTFDDYQLGHPFLLSHEDHFWMWYTGYQRRTNAPRGLALRIGRAELTVRLAPDQPIDCRRLPYFDTKQRR